jgi:aminopeptidase N
MKDFSPRTVYLKEYSVPPYLVKTVDLHFDLREQGALVSTVLEIYRNPDDDSLQPDLQLNGVDLELLELSLDGSPLGEQDYELDSDGLRIPGLPEAFILQSVVKISPETNTALEGLYQSSGNYCTQCEAHGFRKITFYLDRPDVMAVFTTTIEADRVRYPQLLSNGNPVSQGEKDNGRHWVKWHDPHKKPAYLFALVAGDLAITEDAYTTQSGREVALRIYTEHYNADKTAHAMRSLKKAMRWDEECYGLEYDLDIYMIVSVDDFNMGAMENKGLNVFNSKYVLAQPETATDTDYINIEAVIAHEYFHNWTGNRVTCRDWFQLSLKEGLTVFRDQSFTADMTSLAVKRIDDVRALRTHQFAEDASPMAHPVRPASYIEINNFYTLTVYEKGAEVVRMYQTLLGREGFRRGMDLYFERHDGQAVTTEDFRAAMADANHVDLSQLQRWYDQAGTPEVHVADDWDESSGHYTLHMKQSCPATAEMETKAPFLIPIEIGLLGTNGQALDLQLPQEQGVADKTRVLSLTQAEQSFTFVNISERPLPSLLRNFSAPVKVHYDYTDAQLAFLISHDSDDFNRWEAGQRLSVRALQGIIEDIQANQESEINEHLREAFSQLLDQKEADPALLAEAMLLPSEGYLAEQMEVVDVDAIHAARERLRYGLADTLQAQWQEVYQASQTGNEYGLSPAEMGKRRLRNCALNYLLALNTDQIRQTAVQHYEQAQNMTDTMGALGPLVSIDCPEREAVLQRYHDRWKDDALVIDKWFSLQAMAPLPGTLKRVQELMKHPLFSMKNPNKVRALIGAFAQGNPVCFHAADGSGYTFLASRIIELDLLNPQIAARLSKVFSHWRRYDNSRQQSMQGELKRILSQPKLSRDVYEVVQWSLQEN